MTLHLQPGLACSGVSELPEQIHLRPLKTPCHISIFPVTYAQRAFLCREASLKIAL